jgi:hypothetical protein
MDEETGLVGDPEGAEEREKTVVNTVLCVGAVAPVRGLFSGRSVGTVILEISLPKWYNHTRTSCFLNRLYPS